MVSTHKQWLSYEEVREFRLSGMSTERKVLAIRERVNTIPPVELANVLGISREWARKLLERTRGAGMFPKVGAF